MVCNLIIRNMKEKFTIDGIQFETPNGEDIFLDFCSQEFSKVSDYMTYFNLKDNLLNKTIDWDLVFCAFDKKDFALSELRKSKIKTLVESRLYYVKGLLS